MSLLTNLIARSEDMRCRLLEIKIVWSRRLYWTSPCTHSYYFLLYTAVFSTRETVQLCLVHAFLRYIHVLLLSKVCCYERSWRYLASNQSLALVTWILKCNVSRIHLYVNKYILLTNYKGRTEKISTLRLERDPEISGFRKMVYGA